MSNKNLPHSSSVQESYVLQALADIRKLVFYKLSSAHRDAAEDLMQRVFCKVWSWKIRHDKTLEYEDWRKITKTIAYREISEYFSENYSKEVLFSQMCVGARDEFSATMASKNSLEGNTRAELDSLMLSLWKAAQILTLRQRYAFLLHSDDFLLEFIDAGHCRFEELASYFDITKDLLFDIMRFIPLSDLQIRELLSAKLNKAVTSEQIWDARAKAKSRLLRLIKRRSEKLFARRNNRTIVRL